MNVFTTINPNDVSETQLNAISSWTKKYKVYSVNRRDEIEKIKDIYKDVTFIETDDTYLYKNKKLIKLNAILDSIRKVSNGLTAIINSDIILTDELDINIKNRYLINGIFIGTRYELDNGKKYPFIYGYDIFIFNSKYAALFKNEKYDDCINIINVNY
jgi:hypothetical protein